MDKCSRCGGKLEYTWITIKGENICMDCTCKMKNPPHLKTITPEQIQYYKDKNTQEGIDQNGNN